MNQVLKEMLMLVLLVLFAMFVFYFMEMQWGFWKSLGENRFEQLVASCPINYTCYNG